MLTSLRIHAAWRVKAEKSLVYTVLDDMPNFPKWWPNIDSYVDGCLYSRTLGGARVATRVTVVQRAEHVLGARHDGEFPGWSTWRLKQDGEYTEIEFLQQLRFRTLLGRLMGMPLHPLMKRHFMRAMEQGHVGLREYLADIKAGREPWPKSQYG